MIITYHGGECVKVSAGDTTLVFGPVSKQSKDLKPSTFGTDIAFISLDHPDMNGVSDVSRAGSTPFVISGPGEYEVASAFATGFETRSLYAGEPLRNTVFEVLFDGINLLYLGALSDATLPAAILEEIDSVDVLFVPIGASGVLTPTEAHKLAVSLEAKIIIHVHWGAIGSKDALEHFLKEAGVERGEQQEKLTIKPRDVEGKTGDVVVLGQ